MADFLDDLVVLFAGLAQIGAGSAYPIPTGDGPYLTVIETGGTAPAYRQNQAAPVYANPAAQVTVTAKTYQAARAVAKAAYDRVADKHNATINGCFYMSLRPLQEPFDGGLDDSQRARVRFNLIASGRQPS